MSIEKLKVMGSMKATLVKGNGDVEVTKKDNIIVAAGFDFICAAVANGSSRPAAMGYIAVGLDNTAPDLNDTDLTNEKARKAATYAHTGGTYVFTMTTTFNPGEATDQLVEAGVFNASTGGTMLDRVTFPAINKGSADSLTIQFTFTLS